ncbi:MAG: paraquat-inducible protein A [Thermodesulfobacteriota bacterium]
MKSITAHRNNHQINQGQFLACHECDLVNHVGPVPEGRSAVCRRCGSVLFSRKPDSLNRSLALTVTGLTLFVIANVYPLLAIKKEGIYQATTLLGGVRALYEGGYGAVALLVLFTTVLFPLCELLVKLHILFPLTLNRRPWKMIPLMHFLEVIRPWGMMEVYMLGILVSVVKLVKMVTVIPGTSLYAFFALIFVVAAGAGTFDSRDLWKRAGEG